MASLIQKEAECFICKTNVGLQKHHCLTGCRRQMAEREGLWVYLCAHHHTGAEGVHSRPKELLKLKRAAQAVWLLHHNGDREQWLKLFGKSYL